MELEQWSKRTVGVGEPRIGRDNPRGTGYPQDRTFGLGVTWDGIDIEEGHLIND